MGGRAEEITPRRTVISRRLCPRRFHRAGLLSGGTTQIAAWASNNGQAGQASQGGPKPKTAAVRLGQEFVGADRPARPPQVWTIDGDQLRPHHAQ